MELLFEDVSADNEFDNFDCGNHLLNTRICNDAYYNNVMKIGHSCKIIYEDQIVGCFMLIMNKINSQGDDDANLDYFALCLDVLAIDIKYQKQYIGTSAISYIISEAKKVSDFCGCRYLILTPVPDKIKWYEDRGFSKYIDENGNTFMIIDWRDNGVMEEYFEL